MLYAFICVLAGLVLVGAVSNTTLTVDQLVFSGKWVQPIGVEGCNNEELRYSETIGDSLSLTFTGVAVYLRTTFAWDRGLVSIDLDGQTVERQGWVDDESTKVWFCGMLFIAEGLEYGTHTLKATIIGEHKLKTKFEVVSITYSVPDGETPSPAPQSPPPNEPPATSSASGDTRTPSTNPPTSSSSLPAAGSSSSSSPVASPSGQPVDVTPFDSRISYTPNDSWITSSSDSMASQKSLCSTNTKFTSVRGAAISFPFKGTAIYLKSIPGPSSGIFSVSIDGQKSEVHDNFDPGSTLCSPKAIAIKTGLPDVEHVVSVSMVGASNITRRSGETGFEFAGFMYYGQNAFGTAPSTTGPSTNENQAILIGGSVAGVVVIFELICVGVFYYLRRRREADNPPTTNAPAPATGHRQTDPSFLMSPSRLYLAARNRASAVRTRGTPHRSTVPGRGAVPTSGLHAPAAGRRRSPPISETSSSGLVTGMATDGNSHALGMPPETTVGHESEQIRDRPPIPTSPSTPISLSPTEPSLLSTPPGPDRPLPPIPPGPSQPR